MVRLPRVIHMEKIFKIFDDSALSGQTRFFFVSRLTSALYVWLSAIRDSVQLVCPWGVQKQHWILITSLFNPVPHDFLIFFLQKNDTSCIHVRFFIPKLQLFSSVWWPYFKFHPERIISKMVMYHLSWKLIKIISYTIKSTFLIWQ